MFFLLLKRQCSHSWWKGYYSVYVVFSMLLKQETDRVSLQHSTLNTGVIKQISVQNNAVQTSSSQMSPDTHTHTHASRQTLPRTTCRPINIITADDIQILQLNSRIERWCTDSNSIKQTIMVLQATSNSTAARACPGPQCGRGLTALPQTL